MQNGKKVEIYEISERSKCFVLRHVYFLIINNFLHTYLHRQSFFKLQCFPLKLFPPKAYHFQQSQIFLQMRLYLCVPFQLSVVIFYTLPNGSTGRMIACNSTLIAHKCQWLAIIVVCIAPCCPCMDKYRPLYDFLYTFHCILLSTKVDIFLNCPFVRSSHNVIIFDCFNAG